MGSERETDSEGHFKHVGHVRRLSRTDRFVVAIDSVFDGGAIVIICGRRYFRLRRIAPRRRDSVLVVTEGGIEIRMYPATVLRSGQMVVVALAFPRGYCSTMPKSAAPPLSPTVATIFSDFLK